MTNDLTTDQLLAILHLENYRGEHSDHIQALARSFADGMTESLPHHDTAAAGEMMMHIASKATALAAQLAGQGVSETKALRLVLNVITVAGAGLFTANMTAGEVDDRVAAALYKAWETL